MIWDDILDEMDRMQRRINRLFASIGRETGILGGEKFPDYRRAFCDIRETTNEFIVNVELPGIEKENIKLITTNTGLEIRAEKKKEEKKETEEGEKYSKSYAGFYQLIDLPENADLDKVDAIYKNGVLEIRVPKKKIEEKKKEIKIN